MTTQHTVFHGGYTIERDYPTTPAKVFAAFADPEVKRRWTEGSGPNDMRIDDYQLDFREGGVEHHSGRVGDRMTYAFQGRYHDIVPDSRIVYDYELAFDGRRSSVSVATVELTATHEGTRVVFTEQGAYLDDIDHPDQRCQGTEMLLDNLPGILGL